MLIKTVGYQNQVNMDIEAFSVAVECGVDVSWWTLRWEVGILVPELG